MTSKQLTKNFLFLFFSNVIGQLFTLAAFVHIAKVFGPEGFGRFSFAQVVSLYFLYLADFGLQTFGTRQLARERTGAQQLVRTISLVRVLMALLAFVLLVLFVSLLNKPGDVKTLILMFGISSLPTALLLEWVYQGLERMEIVAVGRVLRGLVFALLVYLLVRGPEHVHLAAGLYVFGILAATIALALLYLREFGWHKENRYGTSIKMILLAAVPLATGSFITQVNYNFGTFALGLYLTDDDVGRFSAAYKIILFLWAFVVVAASNAVLPMLVRVQSEAKAPVGDIVQRLLRWFAIAAVPLGVGGAVLADDIIHFLYPPPYADAAIVLRIGIWIVCIVMMRTVFENVLLATQREQQYFRGYIVAGGATVVGNLALVPYLGLLAPILVSIGAEIALLTYFAIASGYGHAKILFRALVGPLVAAGIMGLIVANLPLNILLLIPVGGLVYVVFLVVLRVIPLADLLRYCGSFLR